MDENRPIFERGQVLWDMLRRGRAEESVVLFRERYTRDQSGTNTFGLGAALMWVEDYNSAAEHFQRSIETRPTKGEEDYSFVGAAKWCLEDKFSAVEFWKLGAKARYAIGGVCTHSPLLLLLASILSQEVFTRTEAEKMLLMKASDPRAQYWPGTLAQFFAGLIDNTALEKSWVWVNQLGEHRIMPDRRWMTGFYMAVLELSRGSMSPMDFSQLIRPMVDAATVESMELDDFMALARSPEFYIARHEARKHP